MRYRPTEVRRIAELLDEPCDDVTELSKRVIAALDGLRAQRSGWYLNFPRVGPHIVYGPFANSGAAVKAAQVAAIDGKAAVAYLVAFPPEALSDLEIIDLLTKGETQDVAGDATSEADNQRAG